MTLDKITSSKVLIIGDIILDKYIVGEVSRISPEAPVPILKAGRVTRTLGGAGNVAHNVAKLKAGCTILGTAGAVGADQNRAELEGLLGELDITTDLLEYAGGTITKIRVVGGRQQIVRIDYENVISADDPILQELKAKARNLMQEGMVVVLSDYGKGALSDEVSRYLISAAREKGLITVVDPKGADWSKYQNATIITPNVKELAEAAGTKLANTDDDIVSTGRSIREKYNLTYLLVTRSEKGSTLISADGVTHFATQAKEVFDVSGAGDTVVATLACTLGGGIDIAEAVSMANAAAGIVVSKVGTAPVTYPELLHAYTKTLTSAALTRQQAESWVQGLKQIGKKVVFTNGCFDLLHRGHVDYLEKAKKLGDALIIGLNSDKSVKRLKGDSRPINNEEDRAFMLSALESVDAVVIFDEETPYELLKVLCPDILAKGGDYKPHEVIGREFAGETVIIPFVDGYSSSSIIKKMTDGK